MVAWACAMEPLAKHHAIAAVTVRTRIFMQHLSEERRKNLRGGCTLAGMPYTRRDLALLLPALAGAAATAQEPKNVLPSKVYKFEDLPVKTNGQNKSRAVLNGQLHSGFPV